MFLTNELTPAELLSEMLARKRATRTATRAFQRLKHDRDLCPAFLDSIATILDVYKSHSTRAYDIQGMQDRGVDILIRFEEGRDIGVQVKSFAEFEKWAAGNDKQFIQRLKSQYADAMQTRKVDAYYIVLCTDATKHEKQVRSIGAQFAAFSSVTIISPQEAMAFYNTGESQLAGATARMLCEDDLLLEKACAELQGLPAGLAHLVLVLLCRAFSRQGQNIQLVVSDDQLAGWIEDWERASHESKDDKSEDDEREGYERDEPTLQELYEELASRGYLTRTPSGHAIEVTAFSNALLAVCLGEAARNDFAMEAALPYLKVLLEVD
jgi:hypothetical protein